MTSARRGTFLWRLYALGLVQLVLLVAVYFGVGVLVVASHPHDEPRDGPQAPGPMRPDGPPPDGPHPAPPPRAPHHRPSPMAPLLTLLLGGVVIVGIGSVVTARWIARPLQDLSRAAKALGAGDLTARSGLARDDEMGELGRAFDEMAERIQTLMLAEKELMANVSHELRTPLARIRVALDIAGEGDAETGRVSMSEIGLDLSELETLIDDILTATRLEIAGKRALSGSYALHVEEIGPEAIVERAAERFRARHPMRPLDVSVEAGLPILRADPVLIRRVVDNLLENAHKYSPDPGRSVALRVAREGTGVAFEVKDDGMGIPDGDLPHVFAPFFRGERSRARGTGGVGLGLTLAKRIVEAHEGAIGVTSGSGSGTTVRFVLPTGLH